MDFLNNIWDAVRSVAPTVAGTLTTGATGNPLIGGAVASIIKSVLGKPDDGKPVTEEEARELISKPELYLKFRTMMQEMEIKKLQEETKRVNIVNQTMQIESKSESKAQRWWRPYNGFLFGSTLFIDYILAQIIVAIIDPFKFVWIHVPDSVYMLWAMVLGVMGASRGFEKVAKMKPTDGLLNTLKGVLKR